MARRTKEGGNAPRKRTPQKKQTPEDAPAYRLDVQADVNGVVGKTVITAYGADGNLLFEDRANMQESAERRRVARRLDETVNLSNPQKALADLEQAWFKARNDNRRKREQVEAGSAEGPPPEGGPPPCDGRPTITISTREDLVNAEAAAALAGDLTLYQRGNLLVRVVRDDVTSGKGIRRPVAPRIDLLPQPLLREKLAERAAWFTEKETKEGTELRPAHPPAWSVAAVHARANYPGVRHLEAIVDHPVLRPDGTVLCHLGYDPATGLILETDGLGGITEDDIGRIDPRAARDELLDVVADFPFDRPEHRSAWLAALLTPLARFAFEGPAPLFLADANVPAAGKGLLFHVLVWILRGLGFTVCTYTQDEDELRKRIFSLALEGERLVLLDNLEGKFGCATLDAVLTASSMTDRVLGGSRTATVPLLMTWFGTGNNVLIGADTARRVCHIRLESAEARPEERKDFKHPNLIAWVGANRGRLLRAALAILRGYCRAGRPEMNLPAWGSFEGWSALVRSAVAWVGLPDPGLTRMLLQERSDTVAECMSGILAGWARMDPDRKGLTAAEVLQQLYPRQTKDAPTPPAWHGDFRAALESLLGKPDTRALGNKLRSYRRRIFGDRFMDRVGTEHQAVKWAVYHKDQFRQVTRATAPAGECGESGESVSPHDQSDRARGEERQRHPPGAPTFRPPGETDSPDSPDSPDEPFTTPFD
jgi:hypothetical protein